MPSLPTTWQQLPPWLLEPVMAQHLTLEQASRIWDCDLMAQNSPAVIPDDLWPAVETLLFLEVNPPSPLRH